MSGRDGGPWAWRQSGGGGVERGPAPIWAARASQHWDDHPDGGNHAPMLRPVRGANGARARARAGS